MPTVRNAHAALRTAAVGLRSNASRPHSSRHALKRAFHQFQPEQTGRIDRPRHQHRAARQRTVRENARGWIGLRKTEKSVVLRGVDRTPLFAARGLFYFAVTEFNLDGIGLTVG